MRPMAAYHKWVELQTRNNTGRRTLRDPLRALAAAYGAHMRKVRVPRTGN